MTRFVWVKTSLKPCRIFISTYGKVLLFFLLFLSILSTSSVLLSVLRYKKLEVAFLNVGQGDATLITTPNGYQILIDGGRDLRVLGELKKYLSYFDTSIDMVILTHADGDHLTGLLPVFEKYNVGHVVTSAYMSDSSLENVFIEKVMEEKAMKYVVSSGDSIYVDGITLRIHHPKKNIKIYGKDTNATSLSFTVLYGDTSSLFTGDLSSVYEPALIVNGVPRDISVYKAGHHGSKTSSGEVLMAYIKPLYSVISAGEGNAYGHPHNEVIERLIKYKSTIFSTITNGTIIVKTDGKSIDVSSQK